MSLIHVISFLILWISDFRTQAQQVPACNCTSSHPQIAFCRPGFAIRGLVRSVTLVPDRPGLDPNNEHDLRYYDYQYTVRVQKVFQTDSTPITRWSDIQVYTFASPDMCSTNLTVGTRYLIFGGTLHGKLRTSSCSSNQIWNTITYHQIISLNRRYRQNCACANFQTNTLSCALPSSSQIAGCYFRFGTCISNMGRCDWFTGGGLRNCI